MNFLQRELECVRPLVEQCGHIALEVRAGGADKLGIEHKPRGEGPVTRADRELNERIVEALSRAFPGDAIVAEESPEPTDWRVARRCWFVDPIDGTREYARGTDRWTVQVGLCIDGEPVLGVVAEPALARSSWAVLGPDGPRSGRREGDGSEHPLRTSDRDLATMVFSGAKALVFSRQSAIHRALDVDASRAQVVGSVGVRMTRIARGEADAYVQPPGRTKLWDTAAPAVLVRAAGGFVTDLRGAPLNYQTSPVTHRRGVVAATARLHGEILERVSELADAWLRP
jgi:3'(2'), 5'-bisphosphate nucleotidase